MFIANERMLQSQRRFRQLPDKPIEGSVSVKAGQLQDPPSTWVLSPRLDVRGALQAANEADVPVRQRRVVARAKTLIVRMTGLSTAQRASAMRFVQDSDLLRIQPLPEAIELAVLAAWLHKPADDSRIVARLHGHSVN